MIYFTLETVSQSNPLLKNIPSLTGVSKKEVTVANESQWLNDKLTTARIVPVESGENSYRVKVGQFDGKYLFISEVKLNSFLKMINSDYWKNTFYKGPVQLIKNGSNCFIEGVY